MNENTLVRILISIPEAKHLVKLLYDEPSSNYGDLIRELEMAIGDAYLEAEPEEQE